MKYVVSIIFCLVALIGCGGSDKTTSKQVSLEKAPQSIETVEDVINTLRAKGDIPTLDRSDSLAGPDENSNGVRDDIDAFIAKLSLTGLQAEASHSFAKSLQKIQSLPALTSANSEIIGQELVKTVSCFLASHNDSDQGYKLLNKLEAYTANTYNRAVRYNKYNELRDGSVLRLPDDSACI